MAEFDFSGIQDSTSTEQSPDFSGVDQHSKTGFDFSGVDETNAAEKYGTPIEQVKTAAESAAGGATFNLSRLAESKLLGNAEEQRQREIANPALAGTSEVAGAVAGLLGPEELLTPVKGAQLIGKGVEAFAQPAGKIVAGLADPITSPIVAKILEGASKLSPRALGSAVETSIYGLGQSVKEEALGEPGLTGENIAHNMGYAALLGGGLDLGLGLGAKTLFKTPISEEAKNLAEKDQLITKAITKPEAPTSLEEITALNKAMARSGVDTNLPQYEQAVEASKRLAGKLDIPPHQFMLDSLKNEADSLKYKMQLKSDSGAANELRQYQYGLKSSGVDKFIPETIQNISPESTLAENSEIAGNQVIDSIMEKYEVNKAQDAEKFNQLEKLHPIKVDQPENIIKNLYSDFPKLQQYVTVNEDGQFFLKTYDRSSGIQKETWPILRDLIKEVNKPGLDIGDIRSIRDSLKNAAKDWTKSTTAQEVSDIRAQLMEYMQDQANKTLPELGIRDMFKRYAINEQNLSDIERILGGSLDDRSTLLKAVKSEKVLDKIFNDLRNVRIMKNFMEPKEFSKMTANYLNQIKESVTDRATGTFKSGQFDKKLFSPQKDLAIQEALSDHPEQLQDLKDITTLMKILPDAPKGNPSDTAAAADLIKKAQKWTSALLHPTSIPGTILETIGQKIDEKIQRGAINAALRGEESSLIQKNRMYDTYIKIERMNQKLDNNISSGVKNILNAGSAVKNLEISRKSVEDKREKFEKISNKLQSVIQNPEIMYNKMNVLTSDLYKIAPNIAIQTALSSIRAAQFLSSKLPVQPPSSLFSEPLKPSTTDIDTFNRYKQIVIDPLAIFNHIKDGTLTHEHMEAISTVHPKIFEQMQRSVMDELINNGKGKDLSYSKKLILSMFTGQDLTNSLKPQNIAMSQSILAAQPTPSKQGARSYSKIDKSSQLLTDNQKVESGEDRA